LKYQKQIQSKAAKAPKNNKAPVSQPGSVSEAIDHSHTKQNTTSKSEIRQLSSSEPPDPDEVSVLDICSDS